MRATLALALLPRASPVFALVLLLGLASAHLGSATGQGSVSDPWTSSQLLQPADLAKSLADARVRKPLVVCVGFAVLYKSAHIPGALFHGPGAKPEGIEDLKMWAATVSKEQPIVIYCGCCPMVRCPNVRPAFKALRELGLKDVKLLYLRTDLATDWIAKGFPTAAGR